MLQKSSTSPDYKKHKKKHRDQDRHRGKDGSRDKDHTRERDRNRDKDRDRGRDRNKNREKDRDRDKGRDRDKDKNIIKDSSKEKERIKLKEKDNLHTHNTHESRSSLGEDSSKTHLSGSESTPRKSEVYNFSMNHYFFTLINYVPLLHILICLQGTTEVSSCHTLLETSIPMPVVENDQTVETYHVPVALLPDSFVENVWSEGSASTEQFIDGVACSTLGADVLVCHQEEVCNEIVCASEVDGKESCGDVLLKDEVVEVVEPLECHQVSFEGNCVGKSGDAQENLFEGTGDLPEKCDDILPEEHESKEVKPLPCSSKLTDDNHSRTSVSTSIFSVPSKVKEEKRPSVDEVKIKTESCVLTPTESDKQPQRRPSSSGSSSHKSSRRDSDKKDHRSSSHHCSRCYKRSKIKRASIGVQCRRDKTVEKLLQSVPPPQPPPPSAVTWHPAQRPSSSSSTSKPQQYTHPPADVYRYSQYMHIEAHPNGGATVVHMYQDELNHLSPEQMNDLSDEFFKVC